MSARLKEFLRSNPDSNVITPVLVTANLGIIWANVQDSRCTEGSIGGIALLSSLQKWKRNNS